MNGPPPVLRPGSFYRPRHIPNQRRTSLLLVLGTSVASSFLGSCVSLTERMVLEPATGREKAETESPSLGKAPRLVWEIDRPTDAVISYTAPQLLPSGDIVVATKSLGNGHGKRLPSVSAMSLEGDVRWSFSPPKQVSWLEKLAVAHIPRLSARGEIVFLIEQGTLYKLDREGKLLFNTDLNVPEMGMPIPSRFCQPLLTPTGEIFLGLPFGERVNKLYSANVHDQGVYKISKDGEILWRANVGWPVIVGLEYFPEAEALTVFTQRGVHSLDVTGESRWKREHCLYQPGIISPQGKIQFFDLGVDENHSSAIYQVGQEGKVEWTYPTPGGRETFLVGNALGEVVFAANLGKCSRVTKLGGDGAKIWEFAVEDEISVPPVFFPNGDVLVSSCYGPIYRLDAKGNEKWRFDPQGRVLSTPVFAPNGDIILASFYLRDYKEGLFWKFIFKGFQKIYRLNAEGEKIWDYEPTTRRAEGMGMIDDPGDILLTPEGDILVTDSGGRLSYLKERSRK